MTKLDILHQNKRRYNNVDVEAIPNMIGKSYHVKMIFAAGKDYFVIGVKITLYFQCILKCSSGLAVGSLNHRR